MRYGQEIWKSEKENVLVFYSQFDMGLKYKVYRKVSYDGSVKLEFVNSFPTQYMAVNHARQIYDKVVER